MRRAAAPPVLPLLCALSAPGAGAAPADCLPLLWPMGGSPAVDDPSSWLPNVNTTDMVYHRLNSGLFDWYNVLIMPFETALQKIPPKDVIGLGGLVSKLVSVMRFIRSSSPERGNADACWEAARTHRPPFPAHLLQDALLTASGGDALPGLPKPGAAGEPGSALTPGSIPGLPTDPSTQPTIFAGGAHVCVASGHFGFVELCAPSACSEADTAAAMEQVVDRILDTMQQLNDILHGKLIINGTIANVTKQLLLQDMHVNCDDTTKKSYGKDYTTGAKIVVGLIVGLAILSIGNTMVLYVYEECIHPFLPPGKNEPTMTSTAINSTAGQQTEKYELRSPPRVPRPRVPVICKAFDIRRNTAELMKSRVGPTSFLDFMRFWSIEWVILGHTYQQVGMGWSGNPDKSSTNIDFRTVFIQPAYLGVDTFFFLSGFLAARKLIRDVPALVAKAEGRVLRALAKVYILAAIMRWLRLVPILGFVMLLVTHLLGYMGAGPVWFMLSNGSMGCSEWWWKNILFINNFWPMQDQCIPWVWYLANDYQFSLVLPFIAMPYGMGGTPRLRALCLLAGLMLMNWVFAIVKYDEQNAYIKPYHRFAPYGYGILLAMFTDSLAKGWSRSCCSDNNAESDSDSSADDPEENAHVRAVPISTVRAVPIGEPTSSCVSACPTPSATLPSITTVPSSTERNSVACSPELGRSACARDTACLITPRPATTDGAALFRSAALRATCYTASFSLMFSAVFLMWRVSYDTGRGAYVTQSFLGLLGTEGSHVWGPSALRFMMFWWDFAWGLGLMLLCLPLLYGGGGMLRRVMGLPVWAPFAKLTYGTYMIHIVLISGFIYSQTTPLHFSDWNLLMWWVSISGLSWATSYALWLLIEAPAANITGMLFRKAV